MPLGNGHAVLVAKDVVGDEPFAVLWGDDLVVSEVPCLRQMIDVYERYGRSVLAAMRVPTSDYSKYGMIKGKPVEDRICQVEDIVEKPAIDESPGDLAQVKGFILTPEIFEMLEKTPAKKGGEIWLGDAIQMLLRYQTVYAYEFAGRRYDAGNVFEYIKAQVDFALMRDEFRDDFKEYLRGLDLSDARLPAPAISPG